MKTETKILGIGMTERNVPKVMSGAKTQTRRIIRDCYQYMPHGWSEDGTSYGFRAYSSEEVEFWKKSKHQIGDRLYVKEALQKAECPPDHPFARYKSDSMPVQPKGLNRPWKRDDGTPWKNKVIPARYMPRSAARTFIEITDVRCDRIQNISVEDCWDEGCELTEAEANAGCTVKAKFQSLWNDTNGQGAWERNDWTFAYTFKLIENGAER